MSDKKSIAAYASKFNYSNDVELLDTVMNIFAVTTLKVKLSSKERMVLREYMINGYSSLTKKSVSLTLKIKATNLNTLNCILQKKGFLIPHPTNQRLKLISPELVKLRDLFLGEKDRKIFIVEFLKVDN